MAAPLTPGLTPFQRQRVADILHRVGCVPMGQLAGLFVDVDRAGVRAIDPVRPSGEDCRLVAAALAYEHHLEAVVVSFAYGLAVGVRQGRTFAPPPPRRSKWISDEYKRLSEPSRRDVQKYIRTLLRAQEPPKPPAPPAALEVEAARRWVRAAGKLARTLR